MHSIANNRILLIEDHSDLAETIIDFLETLDCIVDYAADGLSGLQLATSQQFDIILLDVMLPGMDGLELCRKLRDKHRSSVPVLMMTARDELKDKLIGFEAGADDYLVKPFELPELVARVAAQLRRNKGFVTDAPLKVGELELDPASRCVHRAEQQVTLTPTGFQILTMLMKNSPNIVTREQIEAQLWGDEPPASDTLRSQIYKLRKQVDKPFAYSMIETTSGAGYRLVPQEDA